jgi:hypothetical protein
MFVYTQPRHKKRCFWMYYLENFELDIHPNRYKLHNFYYNSLQYVLAI